MHELAPGDVALAQVPARFRGHDALTPGAVTPMSAGETGSGLGGEKGGKLAGETGSLPPGAPAPGSDPKAVKQWWDSLSPQQKQAMADQYPDYVGSTNGIPSAVRDYSNRKVLDRLNRPDEATAMYRRSREMTGR